jgi:hypothetical protein
VNVLVTIGLEEALVEQVQAVDPRLEVSVLDREAALLFWGRPLPPEVDREAVRQRLDTALAEVEVLYGFPPSPENARRASGPCADLRWFQAASAGVDRLEQSGFQAAGRRHQLQRRAPRRSSEYVLMVMLMFAKRAPLPAGPGREALDPLPACRAEGQHSGGRGHGADRDRRWRGWQAAGCCVLGIRRSAASRRAEKPGRRGAPPSDLPHCCRATAYVLAAPHTGARHLIGRRSCGHEADGSAHQHLPWRRHRRDGAGAALRIWDRRRAGRLRAGASAREDSELWGMENVIVSPTSPGGTEF